MSKETASRSENLGKSTKMATRSKADKSASTLAETYIPEGSWQRVTSGVVAAAAGGLIAAAVLGVGPAALAGTAGYLAYKGLNSKTPKEDLSFKDYKH